MESIRVQVYREHFEDAKAEMFAIENPISHEIRIGPHAIPGRWRVAEASDGFDLFGKRVTLLTYERVY